MLSERAGRLLSTNEKGRLCAVTFTRDAADELKERIIETCGKEHAMRLAVGTFHSLALSQLKRFCKKPPRLISEGERMAVLRRCWKQHAPEHPFEDVVKVIDAAKARVYPAPFSDPSLEAVYHGFEEIMASEGAMDFSDLILGSVRRMKSGEMHPLPVRWLLVDEAQDMDEVQMEWILMHGKSGIEVTLVGDDDQSLYAFRHAMGYAGIQEVTFALSATETTLPVNYRCAPNILGHAAKLIAHNQNRAHKKISAFKEDPGHIQVIKEPTRDAEVTRLAEIIAASGEGAAWAVLGRTNVILDAAEVALTSYGIRVSRSGGKSVWEHSIGSIFAGMLRSVSSGSWTGIANTLSFAGVQASEVNNHSTRTTGVTSCLARLDAAIEHAEKEGKERRTLNKLSMGMRAWMPLAKEGGTNLVIYGVGQFLSEYCKNNQAKLLLNLQSSLVKLNGSIAQRLNFITRSNENKNDGSLEPKIELMTLHASKGLEFDNVWIMGCEEGNLPHTDSTEEDERRLMYVGMTRARKKLIISSAHEEGIESRFVEEAGLLAI